MIKSRLTIVVLLLIVSTSFLLIITSPEHLELAFYLLFFPFLFLFLKQLGLMLFLPKYQGSAKTFSAKIYKRIRLNYQKDPGMVALGLVILTITLIEYTQPSSPNAPVNWGWYLWLSNVVPFLLAYALIFRSNLYITCVFLLTIVYESVWTIDFYSRVFLNTIVFGGRADYIYGVYLNNKYLFFSNLNHLWLLPVSLWGMVKLGVNKKAFRLAGVWMILINLLVWFLAPPEENINCLRHVCDFGDKLNYQIETLLAPLSLSVEAYAILWTLVPPVLVLMPLNYLFYYIDRRLRNSHLVKNRQSD